MSSENLHKHPEVRGCGRNLRDKYPGFFMDLASMTEYIEGTVFNRMQTYNGNEELLDAILEDVKTLIIIDPDMRR